MAVQKLMGVVESVKLIENVKAGLDFCEVVIDFDVLNIFYNYADLNTFIGKQVEYSFREDSHKGKICYVITDIAIFTTIQTVESTNNIKLIPEGRNKRTVCDFCFKDITAGSPPQRVTGFLTKVERGSSVRTKWIDMTILDSESREGVVRVFTKDSATGDKLDRLVESFQCHYVQFLIANTRYGYQVVDDDLTVLTNEVEMSPEVEVAKKVVLDEISKDSALVEFNKKFNFVASLANVIDGEPGYALVRIASELFMINSVDNISTDLDIRAMKRASICSRLYLIPHESNWSRVVFNSIKANSVPELKTDKELLSIIDPLRYNEPTDTFRTYIKIRKMVDDIIKIRRGIVDEEEQKLYQGNNLLSVYSGLV